MSTVIDLPRSGLCNSDADMAAELRALADEIDDGCMAVYNLIVVIETPDGELRRRVFGVPIDNARMVGLLNIAAVRAINGELPP